MGIQKKYHINKDYFLNPLVFGRTLLYQIGRLFCEKGQVIERHCQLNYFELTVVTEGEGLIITNDVPTRVRAGDIYLSLAGDFHEIRSDTTSALRYDYIAVSTSDEKLCAELEYIISNYHDEKCRIIRDEKIGELVADALEEINEAHFLSDTMLSSIFEQIFVRLLRAFRATEAPKVKKDFSDSQLFCWQIMNYIDSHIYTMRSLRELADTTGYNYNYASNLFKAVTGETIMNYYRGKRLKTARLLLVEGKLSVTEISALLNYSSVYAFSRAFKDKYGVSPTKDTFIGSKE